MSSFFHRGPSAGGMEKAFAQLDASGDGALDLDELVSAAEQARGGRAPVRARIASLLQRFDGDGDGKLQVRLKLSTPRQANNCALQ